METKFQTSFIPKKPITSSVQNESSQSRGVSLVMTIGIFLFIISLLAAGGAYGWNIYLASQKEAYIKDLNTQRGQFGVSDITRLKLLNTRIDMAESLLKQHVLTSLVFDKLGALISNKVRFTSMDLSAPGGGKPITVAVSGYGADYETVAWQSDVLGQLGDELRNVVLNPVITNPVKNQNNDTVSFDFSATINPDKILYELPASSVSSGVSATSTSGTASSTSTNQ